MCADKVIVTADGAYTMVNPRKPGEAPPSLPGRLTVEGDATVSRADDGTFMVRFDKPQEA